MEMLLPSYWFFFIILISTSSQISSVKFERLQKVFKGEAVTTNSLEEVFKELEGVLNKNGLSDWVQTVIENDGIIMIIKDNLLFARGMARIELDNKKKFRPILDALNELPQYYRFTIEGHTDDIPIRTAKFPSNWHLSASRALSVLDQFLIYGFEQKRLEVQGHGDQRPLVPNRTKDGTPISGNRKKNRRVVIRIK